MRTSNSNKNPPIFGNKRSRLMGAVCLLAAAGLVQPLLGQSTRIDGGAVSQAQFGFYWETHLEPGTPPMSDSFKTQTTDEPGVIHRILLDRSGRVYAGYDVIVTALPERNAYRVRFQGLTMTPETAGFMGGRSSEWTQLPRSGWGNPAAQEIHGGDVLRLSLFRNPSTGQSVVDYVTVQEPSRKFVGFNQTPERKFTFEPGPSRDFKTDDIALTIQAPRLSINGKLDESSTRRFDEVSGGVVWLYIGKHGRYILSLVPRPELGFRRAGEVRGSSLTFVMGNETFTLNTGGRIAPGQAPFNLYVLHDPDWKPTYPMADLSAFNMGAADRPESLIRK